MKTDRGQASEGTRATVVTPSTRSSIVPARIWVDLDNTPHVPFFLPIIRALESDGHNVLVTARDAFQVCSLADYHGLRYHKVGRHYGANKIAKVIGTLWRAVQLLPIVSRNRPQVALSHGSRPLELLSFCLRLPSMLIFDYEHARRLPFLKPALGVAPDSIDDPNLNEAFRHGLRRYQGLKEDVYASSLRPDASLLAQLGVSSDEILVTLRPPATEAHYHNADAESLFAEVIDRLSSISNVRMVVLRRTAQDDSVRHRWPDLVVRRQIILPSFALNGLNLIWFSDLVVSGGGTMNREAAALGVPVYSIFRGRLGAVDRHLVDDGRLVLLETSDDVRLKLTPTKRLRQAAPVADRPALPQILAAVSELIRLAPTA